MRSSAAPTSPTGSGTTPVSCSAVHPGHSSLCMSMESSASRSRFARLACATWDPLTTRHRCCLAAKPSMARVNTRAAAAPRAARWARWPYGRAPCSRNRWRCSSALVCPPSVREGTREGRTSGRVLRARHAGDAADQVALFGLHTSRRRARRLCCGCYPRMTCSAVGGQAWAQPLRWVRFC